MWVLSFFFPPFLHPSLPSCLHSILSLFSFKTRELHKFAPFIKIAWYGKRQGWLNRCGPKPKNYQHTRYNISLQSKTIACSQHQLGWSFWFTLCPFLLQVKYHLLSEGFLGTLSTIVTHPLFLPFWHFPLVVITT